MRKKCGVQVFSCVILGVFFFCYLIASEVNEAQGMLPDSGKIEKPTHASTSLEGSLKQVNVGSSNEQGLSNASNVAFTSMPPMHINEQVESVDLRIVPVYGGGIDSKSFSEPAGCRGSSGINKNKDTVPCGPIRICGQKCIFSPHLSLEAVEKALEVGNVVLFYSHVCTQFNVATIVMK